MKIDKYSAPPICGLVCGDSRTVVKHICIPRYANGVDLAGLSWKVKIVSENGALIEYAPESVNEGDETICFDWLIQGAATAAAGTYRYQIQGIRTNDNWDTIIWQSCDGSMEVSANLDGRTPYDTSSEAYRVIYEMIDRSLTDVTIPEGLKQIGAHAFSYCTLLKSAKVPNGVRVIGGWAFQYCTSLSAVELPDSVEYISFYAFQGCKSLLTLNLEHLTNLKQIGTSAFSDCTGLTGKIVIPGSVTKIYGEAFAYTTADEIEIAPSESEEKLTIMEAAFTQAQMRSVVIKDRVGLILISAGAFYACENLESIVLGKPISNIGKHAFSGCTKLQNIRFPTSLRLLQSDSFAYCSSLKSVRFNSRMGLIESSAFSGCTALTDIYVPWAENAVKFAPWGAENATVHYNSEIEE